MTLAPFEIGVSLPNAGASVSPQTVVAVAAAAQELGFDSVWASEHLLVGQDVADSYGDVLDNMTTLAWLAGRLDRVTVGTSILLVPLHHPVAVAKRAATLQQLSGGRFRLGVGVGWHEPEFDFLGASFADRGRRADEALRLIRSLWAGERSFAGEHWRFDDAVFGPLPEPAPEIWVGGNSDAAQRRAAELGDVWHPYGVPAEDIAAFTARDPAARVVPRYELSFDDEDGGATVGGSPEAVRARLTALRDAGAAGVVLRFGSDADEAVAAMRRFVTDVAPRLNRPDVA